MARKERKKMSKKKKRIIIASIIVGIVVALILFNFFRSSDKSVKVVQGEVNRGKLVSIVSGPGKVQPTSSVDISAYVIGEVVEVAVEEGESVSAGQLLLRLDDTQYYQDLRRAEAALLQASSALDLAKRQLDEARDVYRRQESLYKEGLISDAEFDMATTAYKMLESNYTSALATYSQAQATLVAARDAYSKTRYTSPIDGIVARINIEEGEVAVPGTMNIAGTVLLEVSNMGAMEVEAEIDEVDVVRVKVGQEARIEVDAFSDQVFKGTVMEIANTPNVSAVGSLSTDEATNFIVTVLLEDAPEELRSGMSATVDIITATKEDCLQVPIQSVVRRDPDLTREDIEEMKKKGTLKVEDEKLVEGVFMVEDDKAVFVPVTTGISDEQNFEVVAGLNEGDTIITGSYKALRKLERGDSVKVVERIVEEGD